MNFDNLKRLMDHFVDDNHTPGNTIQVYLKNEKVFEYSCGYSDREAQKKMTGDEYFYLYSCSKVVTVAAAMQLVEKGIIMLNDPLYEYIPEYRDMYIKNKDGEIQKANNTIKIINLFNMTAGFTYEVSDDTMQQIRNATNGKIDTDVFARYFAKDPLTFEPGEKFQYSLCHDILGAVVAIVTGKKFRDYVKENIFDPLDMKIASYHLTDENAKHMAKQYRFVPHDGISQTDIVSAQKNGSSGLGTFVYAGTGNGHIYGEEFDSGGAGIISNVSDYIKFATALANYGTGLTGERILSPLSIDLMRTNSLDENQLKSFNWTQLAGYGYGLGVRTMIDRIKGGSIGNIGEFGWGGAAGASVYIDPSIGLSAVYAKHTLNPRENYYQPRVRNALYSCL